jgi:hypothetical protein
MKNKTYNRSRRNRTRRNSRRNGGAATVFPLKYFNVGAAEPEAASGHDLLKAIPPIGIRPKIGGKRSTKRSTKRRVLKKRKQQKGGFIPSVMDGFVAAASNYIVPIALFAGYKLLTKKGKKGKKGTRRH